MARRRESVRCASSTCCRKPRRRAQTPIGVAGQTNARAVLGTVPVEPDGSATEAPVGKLIYFQALDETGMAVQSMRSGTYASGERLTCRDVMNSTGPRPAPARARAAALSPFALSPNRKGRVPSATCVWCSPCLTATASRATSAKTPWNSAAPSTAGWTLVRQSRQNVRVLFRFEQGPIVQSGGSQTVPANSAHGLGPAPLRARTITGRD